MVVVIHSGLPLVPAPALRKGRCVGTIRAIKQWAWDRSTTCASSRLADKDQLALPNRGPLSSTREVAESNFQLVERLQSCAIDYSKRLRRRRPGTTHLWAEIPTDVADTAKHGRSNDDDCSADSANG
uniref:Uncharacterized protein n=1 Tax=Trichuris muris TaxID=70415 RepID=A0A5S6QZE0_TRIMR